MVEWLTLTSTLVLVGVTGWYAWLTRSLATSARDSARSAERAAESAAQSVAAAIANVDVRFEVIPWTMYEPGEDTNASGGVLGVTIECAGATVFVHSAHLLNASRLLERSAGSLRFEALVDGPVGHALSERVDLPSRLHGGEGLSFTTDPAVRVQQGVFVSDAVVRVRYSLDGSGDGIERTVQYHYPLDDDEHATTDQSGAAAA